MGKGKLKDAKMLTEVELELMGILWRQGEGTVNDVMAGLSPGRDLAYTSVSTILRILEQKGVLATRKEGRGHCYIPILKKAEYEQRSLRHMVDRVFDGTPVALVRQLLKSESLRREDIDELKALVAKLEQKK